LGSSLIYLGLEFPTDYAVDSKNSTIIYIKDTNKLPYRYKWEPGFYEGTGSEVFKSTKNFNVYDEDAGYIVNGSYKGSELTAAGLTKSDILGWRDDNLYLKDTGVDKINVYKAAHRFDDDIEYKVESRYSNNVLGTSLGSVLNGLSFADSDIYSTSLNTVVLNSSGVTKYNAYLESLNN